MANLYENLPPLSYPFAVLILLTHGNATTIITMPIFLRFRILTLTLLMTLFLGGRCGFAAAESLQAIIARKQVRLGVINSPVSDTFTRNGYQGQNIALASGFADYLGVRLTVSHFYHADDLLQALLDNKLDIAAPLITAAPSPQRFATGPVFQNRPQILVSKPDNQTACQARLIDQGESSPTLNDGQIWLAVSSANSQPIEAVFSAINDQTVRCAVMPVGWYQLLTHQHSNLTASPVANHSAQHAWLISASNSLLRSALFDFTFRSRLNGSHQLAIAERPPLRTLDGPIPTRQFIAQSQPKITALKAMFSFSGQTLPWHLLASVAYTENWISHSAPTANNGPVDYFTLPPIEQLPFELSPPYTTKQFAVALEAHLSALLRQLPAKLQQPDKLQVAIAAFAVGLEHLNDAMLLTRQEGATPFLWANIKQQVSKLSVVETYTHTRYGYANGTMAVHYVDWVQHFSDTLLLLSNRHNSPE